MHGDAIGFQLGGDAEVAHGLAVGVVGVQFALRSFIQPVLLGEELDFWSFFPRKLLEPFLQEFDAFNQGESGRRRGVIRILNCGLGR